MNRCRSTVLTGAAPGLALALLLALTGCADSDEPEPDSAERASGRTSDAETPTLPDGDAPTGEPTEDDSAASGPEGPGGEATGWVMADRLDTNAPVDATSLPDGVTVEQVADARRAWNDRADQLSGEASCEVVGAVWIDVADGAGGAKAVVIGAQEGKASQCDGDPLVTVDAATNAVLEGAEFAALL